MTAEVSIMNRSAVALAADSAITTIDNKVHKTGSKLFAVNHGMPIGIMFYGSTTLLGIPLETALSSFRKHIDKRKFKTVKECGKSFINFLSSNEILYPTDVQKKYYLDYLNLSIRKHLDNMNKEIIRNMFQEEFKKWNNAPYVDGMVENDKDKLLIKYEIDFSHIIDKAFKNHSLNGMPKTDLYNLCANYACKAILSDEYKSGVVFCGFGEEENYPSLYAVELELIVQNKLKFIVSHQFKTTDSDPASIHPFAQREAIISFLRGIDPKFLNCIHGYMINIFGTIDSSIKNEFPDQIDVQKKLMLLIEHLKQKSISNIFKELGAVSEKDFINPTINATETLSKDDLAHMAETLVSLASFRQKMSPNLETICEPIDVAVISKKDGFIWIKRKHYFKPEMNPSYFGGIQ